MTWRVIGLSLAFAGVFGLGVCIGMLRPVRPAVAQNQPQGSQRYLMQTATSQPVDGGHAYCYVYDTLGGTMTVWKDGNRQ